MVNSFELVFFQVCQEPPEEQPANLAQELAGKPSLPQGFMFTGPLALNSSPSGLLREKHRWGSVDLEMEIGSPEI